MDYPALKDLSDMELALLQHEARRFPEDKPFADAILKELGDRAKSKVAPHLMGRGNEA